MKFFFIPLFTFISILCTAQTHVFKRELQAFNFNLNVFKNPFDNSYYLYKANEFTATNNVVELAGIDTSGNITNNIAVNINSMPSFGPVVFPYSTGFMGGFQNMTSSTDYSLVTKIDNNGTVLWAKGYRHPYFLETSPVMVDEPNNMILSIGLLGNISPAAGGTNCLILKTDLNGNVMTTYKYNLVNTPFIYGMRANNLHRLNSGNYIYLASLLTMGVTNSPPIVLQLDSMFHIISSQKILFSQSDPTTVQFIKKPDEGFYAIGSFYESGPNYITYSYIVNFSPSLNKIWAKYTNNNTSTYSLQFNKAQLTPDGGLIIGGDYTSPSGYKDMMLMKVDSMGNINWNQLIGQASDDESMQSFFYDPGDAIYIAGGGYDTAQSNTYVNGLYLKTDLAGNTICGNNTLSVGFNNFNVILNNEPFTESTITVIDSNITTTPLPGFTIIASCDGIVSGIENSESHFNDVSIFPNPASAEFQISSREFGIQTGDEIIFSDAAGRILFTKKISNPTSDLRLLVSDFSNGIYFLEVKTKEGVLNKKVVVQH